MRRYLLFLIFVLSFCFTSGAEARKYALLVGVDEYENVPSLQCCVNDMNTLKEALMKIGFEENDIQMLVTGGEYRKFPIKKKIPRNTIISVRKRIMRFDIPNIKTPTRLKSILEPSEKNYLKYKKISKMFRN